jgi:hypothetical protein
MSKRSGWTLKIILGLAVVAVGIQFIPVDRSNPPVAQAALVPPSEEVGAILRTACYDCHSNETAWPWYSSVAPASWLLADHVSEGRRELNFSTWAEQQPRRMDHKLEELVEKVRDGEMPLKSYTLMHPQARLTDEQRQVLIAWARDARAQLDVPADQQMEHGEEQGERESRERGSGQRDR